MKKVLAVIAVFAMVLVTVGSAFALNKNQSADYARSLNRNASTDVDAAFYNPAGVAFLEKDGLYLQIANQTIIQTKTVKDDSLIVSTYNPNYSKGEYKGDIKAWYFPNIAAAYKAGDLAGFFHFGPLGGGGGGKYNNGLPMFDAMILGVAKQAYLNYMNAGSPLGAVSATQATVSPSTYARSMSFEGTAFNLAGTIGAAYKFDKMFSGALGYRYTYAIREYKGSVSGLNVTSATAGTVLNSNGANYFLNQAFAAAGTDFSMKSTVDGMAHSVVAGANIKPNEDLNIGIKFEYSTALVLKYKTEYTGNANLKTAIETGTNFKDGNKVKDSEPMIAAIGVSYWILPKQLRVEVDVTYSFDSMNALGKDSAGEENNTRYHNFFFAGLALEYVIDKGILASVGYAYDSGSRKDRGRTEMDFGAPVHHVALGGKYAFNETVGMQLGFVYSMYQDTKNDTDSVVTASAPNTAAGLTKVTQNYKMTSYDIGIGVDMKF